jgi:hypothetical protein
MLSRGLDAYDEQLLVNALLALDGEGTDSDGDGAADLDELRQGDDPNAAPGGDAPIVPDYGCSVAALRPEPPARRALHFGLGAPPRPGRARSADRASEAPPMIPASQCGDLAMSPPPSPFHAEERMAAKKTRRSAPSPRIPELFYAGHYAEIVRLRVDSVQEGGAAADLPFIVGALAFVGRL